MESKISMRWGFGRFDGALFLLLLVPALRASAFPQARSAQNPPDDPAACLHCHGNHEPTSFSSAPLLAKQFQMSWNMFEVEGEAPPPFATIPSPKNVLKGKTYYDWQARKMVEVYENQCINIFPQGNDFSCKFLSDHDRTFLITYPKGDLAHPRACCRWTDGAFWAPRPDVLKTFVFQKQTPIPGPTTNWWLYDVPLPGPFGYGTEARTGLPAAFWFPVIGAWAQQDFYGYSGEKPDPAVFEIPQLCEGAPPTCET